MPKICYQSKNFSKGSTEIIEQANVIIENYAAQGFKLTLRQLYYQFVSRDLIPNKTQEYKRLGSIVNDARLAGLIDWDAIEDRTRTLRSLGSWNDPGDIINSAAYSFKLDLWKNQGYRIEVWIEKEALAGVFEPICNELRIPFFCCRGYTSQSEMWGASQRLLRWRQGHQIPVILHFGDHDPSGIDMTRDIIDRLKIFGCPLKLERLALNMDQINQYNPPPNPAKETDSRFSGYVEKFGDESWELDALEPILLAGLVRDAVSRFMDADAWDRALEMEQSGKANLEKASQNWNQVEEYLDGLE